MSRQIPCANIKVSGCQGIVSQRGNIFCDVCIEVRKTVTKSRRDQDVDDLLNKNAELEKQLINLRQLCHEETHKYNQALKNIEIIEEDLSSQILRIENEYQQKIDEDKSQIKLLEAKKSEYEEKYTKIEKLNEELGRKNIELENTISNLKKDKNDNSKYSMYNTQLEKENNNLTDLLSKIRVENQNLVKERETYQMSYSQLKIDIQKMVIDNNRLKSENDRLAGQNEELVKENNLLSRVNQELSEPVKNVPKVLPKKVPSVTRMITK